MPLNSKPKYPIDTLIAIAAKMDVKNGLGFITMPLNNEPNELGGTDPIMRQTIPSLRANFSDLPETVPHPLQRLRELLGSFTQKALADSLGVSPQFINDVLHGRRDVTESLADRLGYQRIVTFILKP